MKLPISILALLLFAAGALAQAPTQQIFVSASGTFRGPLTSGTAQAGETAVTLTTAQYQQIDALRHANAALAAPILIWNSTTGAAVLSPIAQLNQQLLTIYQGLTAAEQDLFAPQFAAVVKHLTANDPQGVYTIIYLSGSGMTAGIATARTNMLNAVLALFPSVTEPQ